MVGIIKKRPRQNKITNYRSDVKFGVKQINPLPDESPSEGKEFQCPLHQRQF
jgi:hypothetical protein